MTGCAHRWLIASPDGTQTCHAVCRTCGAERDYRTTLEKPSYNSDPGLSRKSVNVTVQDKYGSRRTL